MAVVPRQSRDRDEEKKPPGRNYITPAGFRRLQTEFEELRFKTRREVVQKLAEAAAEGDRSENAEYIYRKKQLREIDRRIRFLVRRMSLAEVKHILDLYGERGQGKAAQTEYLLARIDEAMGELEARREHIVRTLGELKVIRQEIVADGKRKRRAALA